MRPRAAAPLSRVSSLPISQSCGGQQVIVDNRPGGHTIIGTQMGARANPDGYTLLFENTTFAVNYLLIRRLTYDSLKDFTPLANLYNNETILSVHPSVPAKNAARV
jgi:tripartite-type tricarboxylate transporter receptor subunit TctC